MWGFQNDTTRCRRPAARRRFGWSAKTLATAAFFGVLIGAAQPTIAQYVQQGPKLISAGISGNLLVGASVALSSVGTTALVGSPSFDGAGGVFVFTQSGGAWTQQGNGLPLTGTEAAGLSISFGESVSLSASAATAVAGGVDGGSNRSAVWVFVQSGGSYVQQGSDVVGSDAVGAAQSSTVAISSDGSTIILGGPQDNANTGAAWIFTRNSSGAWTQQGPKLVGSGAVGPANQGSSVALSADGSTAIVGGSADNNNSGAAWIFARSSSGVWAQQGSKLVGSGAVNSIPALQGSSVALSGDGNTAIVGGPDDNEAMGATWVFVQNAGVWTQQGAKLVGTGFSGAARQGVSVALSTDGNTLMVGGNADGGGFGAAWVFTRGAGGWSQDGPKLVGTGAVGGAEQGFSVALSGNGGLAIVGGPFDDTNPPTGMRNSPGAAWVFVAQPSPLLAAILPASRSAQPSGTVTAFATMINTSAGALSGCSIAPATTLPATFTYQTTNPATNALTGTANTPVNISGNNAAQSFVIAFKPSAAIAPTNVAFNFACTGNPIPAPVDIGLNTLLLSASTTSTPDVVALGATAQNDGFVHVTGSPGQGAFAVATVNLGASGPITASVNTGTASLPLSIAICQTNPSTGQCTSAVGGSVATTIAANATPTFAVFVSAVGTVADAPGNNRIFVTFTDNTGAVRGETSVAVETQ
jgi:hypothetical protein